MERVEMESDKMSEVKNTEPEKYLADSISEELKEKYYELERR
jgi:hypothetical protein